MPTTTVIPLHMPGFPDSTPANSTAVDYRGWTLLYHRNGGTRRLACPFCAASLQARSLKQHLQHFCPSRLRHPCPRPVVTPVSAAQPTAATPPPPPAPPPATCLTAAFISLASKVIDTPQDQQRIDELFTWPHRPAKQPNHARRQGSTARAVSRLVGLGNVSAAAKRVSSPQPVNPRDYTAELDRLHPHPPTSPCPADLPDPSSFRLNVPAISTELVIAHLRQLPPGKAVGPSGCSNTHLRRLLRSTTAIDLLAQLVNLAARGILAPSPAAVRSRAFLLPKPGGGVRPIAVGESLYRFIASVSLRALRPAIFNAMQPYQLALGTRDGSLVLSNIIEHLLSADNSAALLATDCTNAFNTANRIRALLAAATLMPAIYPLAYWAYTIDADLLFNDIVVKSRTGVRQGDPLGPLLFALAIHQPLLDIQNTCHCFAYLDDLFLISSPDKLQQATELLTRRFADIDLSFNVSKFTLYRSSQPLRINAATINDSPGIIVTGIPLGPPDFILNHIDKKTASATTLCNAIADLPISDHDRFTLTRLCVIPRLSFLTRSLDPAHTFAPVNDFCRRATATFLSSIGINDPPPHAFDIASLPPSFGGMGLHNIADTCYLARFTTILSTLSTLQHLDLPASMGEVLPPAALDPPAQHSHHIANPIIADAYSSLQTTDDTPPPTRDELFNRFYSRVRQQVLASVPTSLAARAASALTKDAGTLFSCIPVHASLRLNDAEFRLKVRLHLLIPLPPELIAPCRNCRPNPTASRHFIHAFTCRTNAFHRAHDLVTAAFQRWLRLQDIHSRRDFHVPVRPPAPPLVADLQFIHNLTSTIIDTTIAYPEAPAYASCTGSVAESRATQKANKYAHRPDDTNFVPLALERFGPICKQATALIKRIARDSETADSARFSASTLVNLARKSIAVALSRGNYLLIASHAANSPLVNHNDDLV